MELINLKGWVEDLSPLEEMLTEIFIRSSIENRGIMMSPRRGPQVVSALLNLFVDYIKNDGSEADLAQTAVQFAEQGMAFSTAAKLMQTIQKNAPHTLSDTDQDKLINFQYLFLEQFSNARELVQLRIQENSQMALQHALQKQIEQQRLSNIIETKRNNNLNAILNLNNELASVSSKKQLVDEAVLGLWKSLNLENVCLFEYKEGTSSWRLMKTSATPSSHVQDIDRLNMLNIAIQDKSQTTAIHTIPTNEAYLYITCLLFKGNDVWGALIIQTDANDEHVKQSELAIYIQTFSQNLSALWQNIELLNETEQRAKELEVLYGRFIDDIWQDENAQLVASVQNGNLELNPTLQPTSEEASAVALTVGDHTIGEISLPSTAEMSAEEQEILQSIITEMSDALNNAQLIQTTQAYSTQLNVAVNVSQAATNILDHKQLIHEVVELVRDQFGFYYVGLFLVDDDGETAVLAAGTGEAGRKQIEQNHKHIIGGGSMVGAAIKDGKARVEQDVEKAVAFTRNKLLPETQSELALPLISRDYVIGALTVQSRQKRTFAPTTVNVLQSMANQLAIAIENASLFEQTQTNLEKTNLLYETARKIGASANEREVFNHLVTFAGESNLANIVHIIAEDKQDPNVVLFPALWSDTDIVYDPSYRFPRDKYNFTEKIFIEDILYLRKRDIESRIDDYTKRLLASYKVQNAIYIPMKTENQHLGTVALCCTTNALPSNQQLQPFLTLIDHASIILANQQLLHQSESLYQIGRNINQSLTREDAIEITVQEIGKYTGAKQCRFIAYDHNLGTGTVIASLTAVPENVKTLPIAKDQIQEKLLAEKTPLIITNDDQEFPPEAIEKHLLAYGSTATYFVPCANQQEVIGYLAVDTIYNSRALNSNALIFIQTVVEHLTTQIENIKLLDEALSRAQELITLNQIQSNISKVISVDALAKQVYNQIKRLLDSTIFYLAFFDQESETLTPIHTVQANDEFDIPPRKINKDDPIYQFLIENQQQFTDQSNPLTQAEAEILNIPEPKSALWMPLLNQEGNNFGFMSIQSYAPSAYDENDQQLLRSIATQTSLALSNAQLFETIQAKNKELQQLDQLKTQFLANMSHELRTPLNSIIGFSRVILKGIDGPITPDQEEDLTSIYTNGQHLLMLINEILDMAKIEAGKMSMTFDEVDIHQSAKIASSTVRPLIDEKRIKFIWDVPTDLPMVTADPVRTRQILINLLSNAVKYTLKGHIQLTIRHDSDDYIHIMVADTGIGIAEKDFDKLFSAFEQVDNSTTRTFGGTGLGLPITKWIIEMHNGEIWFETELKKGTTFHVKLPIEQDIQPEEEPPLNGQDMALSS